MRWKICSSSCCAVGGNMRRSRLVAATDPRARAFASLRRLGDVPAILVMQLLEAQETSNTLTDAELLEAIGLARELPVAPRRNRRPDACLRAQVFTRLAQRIDETCPLASLKAALARVPAAAAFPDDDAFRAALEEVRHVSQASVLPPA